MGKEQTIIDGITYTDEEIAQAANLYPFSWVLQNSIKNESGVPITFDKRPFFKDIYNDLSPKQALFKPPQIGATVMSNLKSLWVAHTLRKDIIYTLPTQTDVEDIVGGSINRIITQNPILQSWVKEHDTVSQKSVGESLIRYRGTFSPKQATMVPSSLNIHDEVDNSDIATLTLYETRLEAQEGEHNKWRWYFSHPSLAGHGIDIYWQQSDMKEWHIECSRCKEEQVMSWPDNIDMERRCYICSHCKAPLSEEDRVMAGRWKNRDGVPWDNAQGIVGDYSFSGWHVSQLMLFNKTAEDIINAFNDPNKDRQWFYNYVLGLPYVSSDDKIDPDSVLRNCVDKANSQEGRTFIGVDTGLGLHMTLMNKEGVFYFEHDDEITVNRTPYDRLRFFLNKFPRSVCVIDQGGELIYTRQLQQEFPGRVFLCFYNKDRKSIEVAEWGKDDEYWKVRVDRNRMMTLVAEHLRDTGRVILNGTREEWKPWADQFGNMYREKLVVREQKGKDDSTLYGQQYVWKRSGPDHFAHSFSYCLVGFLHFGGGEMAKVVGESALAGIPAGRIATTQPEQTFSGGYSAADFRSENRVF